MPNACRMNSLTPIQARYLAAAQVFHFAFREHFAVWFTGQPGRHWRTEQVLPALVKKGLLVGLPYGKRYLYAVPERVRLTPLGRQAGLVPYHGLACTDILTRCVRANPRGQVLSENDCQAYRWGAVPEWGIRYPQSTALLMEFCTTDNVERGKVALKTAKYRRCLADIEMSLQAQAIVVFVLDVPARSVAEISHRIAGPDPFFYVDYDSFKAAANVLTAPIYRWGDGRAYALQP